jgi:hypothetical protein
MKNYGVVRHHAADQYGFHWNRTQHRRVAYAQPERGKKEYEWSVLDEQQQVWFCDSEEDAELLAADLSKQFPKYQYVVFKSTSMFQAPPGEPVKSQFTPKGLLPV